jgi:glycine/D-amino acid oxidase-like deaminating enzyme
MATTEFNKPTHVVIAGAGVIGTSTAYYLAKNYGIRSTIVDPTGRIAPAASGKAGGFLALDWNDGSPTQQLTRRSFSLHQQLANDLGADSIQYRRLTCSTISVDSSKRKPAGKKLQGIEWAEEPDGPSAALWSKPLGDEETIAQVHPKMLCERMWEETTKSVGSELCKGKIVAAVHDDNGKLIGGKLENGSIVNGDSILYACGPWTANIFKGVKYHSAVVPTDRVLTQCVFFSGCGDPEVYVRPDSTAYLTGFPDPAVTVQEQPGEERVVPEKIASILESVREASGSSQSYGVMGKDPVVEQSCYLPTTDDGIPVMGKLAPASVGGDGPCFIAAGHTCWGILLGPASGEAMACLIATGKESQHVDMTSFDPGRFRKIELAT